jgi:hypothetical protein
MTSTHNLDINTYCLDEIFALFDLDYNLTEPKMRAAKMKVLMIHPDKSRLPPNYFHFYKQAYEIVLNIYKQKSKPTQATTYTPEIDSSSSIGNNSNPENEVNVSKKVSNTKFNELYDKNMTKKIDQSRFEWFKNDAAEDYSNRKVNPKNMGDELESIKQKQAALVTYKGVQEMMSSTGGGTSYFDEDDASDEYVACDVFGKLKFDDLRKVHKDQTVFAVSERDFGKRTQYASVDHFVRDRDSGGNAPLSKNEASTILEKQRKEKEQMIMNKQHREYMLQKEYEEKQKAVRSAFLQLK